jgi:hypothetical protein
MLERSPGDLQRPADARLQVAVDIVPALQHLKRFQTAGARPAALVVDQFDLRPGGRAGDHLGRTGHVQVDLASAAQRHANMASGLAAAKHLAGKRRQRNRPRLLLLLHQALAREQHPCKPARIEGIPPRHIRPKRHRDQPDRQGQEPRCERNPRHHAACNHGRRGDRRRANPMDDAHGRIPSWPDVVLFREWRVHYGRRHPLPATRRAHLKGSTREWPPAALGARHNTPAACSTTPGFSRNRSNP